MLMFQNIKQKNDFNSVQFVLQFHYWNQRAYERWLISVPGVACLFPKSGRSGNLKYVRVRELQHTSHKGRDVYYI